MDKLQPPQPADNSQLPRAVIFDMDGVLLYSEPFIEQAITQMFEEKGLTIRSEDFTPFVGTGEEYCIANIAAQYDLSLDVEKAKKYAYQIYYQLIEGKLKLLPGVTGFLDKCRRMARKIAIASSADAEKVQANARVTGLDLALFDAVVTGDDVRHKKPNPELFLLVAEKLGVKADECLVVEDAISGIAAAHAAGARCLAVTTSFAADELTATDWIAEDLSSTDEQALAW